MWPGECAGSAACCVSVKAGHVFPLMGSSRVNKQSNCKPSHSPPPATCQQSNQPTRHVYISSTCTDINIHILIYYLCLSPYKAKAFDVLFNENTHLGSKLMFLTISSGNMCRVNQCQDKSSAASLSSAGSKPIHNFFLKLKVASLHFYFYIYFIYHPLSGLFQYPSTILG